MQFKILVSYLEKLEGTSSRNEITQILSDLFKKVSSSEIDKVCYLLSGRLLPSYRGLELNLAEKMMIRILARAYNIDKEKITVLYKQKGDLGDVVLSLNKGKDKGLSVSQVYERLVSIAKEEGAGSQERKVVMMSELLVILDALSTKFVSRIPVGRLRLGFSDMTILDALSVMAKGDKSGRREIE